MKSLKIIDTCSLAGHENEFTNPNASIIIINGGDHNLLNDDNVNKMIVDFLNNRQ